MGKLVVKFEGTILDETVGHDIYNTFRDLFLPGEQRDNMVPEGIQSEDLCKIRSNSRDKKTSGVDAEKKLNEVYGAKYRINMDHQILTDHRIFYPEALFKDLIFEVTLVPASQVVRGSDTTKLKYKLNNIQLQYEMIRSKKLAEEAASIYTEGKEFLYDYVIRDKVIPIDRGTEKRINVKVNAQRRSLKEILLLFMESYAPGVRDSEKYIFPDIKKVSVTINGSPNMIFNNGIESRDIWSEVSHFFMKEKHKPQFMTLHGSGTRLVNSTDGVQLEIERDAKGSGTVNCHVFIIADSQLNIMKRQLNSVQY